MKNRSIKGNAILNIIKQMCQILFPFITIYYASRILGSENYGKVTFGSSIVSYFSLIASLGISTYAIREGSVLKESKKDLNYFCNEIFSINLISTFIAYVLLVILLLNPFFKTYRTLILIQSFSIMLLTLGTDWVNVIFEDYLYITTRYIFCTLLSILLLFFLVKSKEDYIRYAVVCLFASGSANILNILYIRKYVKVKFTFHINFKKHIIPILILFGNIVAITVYVNSDITMLKIFGNDSTVGIYGLDSKIYAAIKQMLNALIAVTIPKLSLLSANGNKEEFEILIHRLFEILIVLIFPLVIGVIFFGKEILYIVGGAEYISGYLALDILMFSIIFSILSLILMNCILITNKKEKPVFIITTISALINIFLNLIFIPYIGMEGAAITTFISELLVTIFSYYQVRKIMKICVRRRLIVTIVFGNLMVIGTCIYFKMLFTNQIIAMVCSAFAAAALYLFVVIKIGKLNLKL